MKARTETRRYLKNNEIAVNQLPFNLLERDIEKETLPYCMENNITVIAYWPLATGKLAKDEYLAAIGRKYGKTPAQVAINWLISHKNVITMPKAVSPEHIGQNAGAANWRLSEEDFVTVSSHFK